MNRQNTVFLIMVAVVAILAGLLFYFRSEHLIDGDEYQYKIIAQNLLLHKTYSLSEKPPYLPTMLREPAYPAFLACVLWFFKGNYNAIYWVQICLFALMLPVFYFFSLRIVAEGVAKWSIFLTALCPTLANHTTYMLSETLFTFLLVLFIAEITRAVESNKTGLYLASSIILGISALIKSVALFLFLPIAFAGLIYAGNLKIFFEKFFKNCLIFILTFLIIITPWSIRNYNKFGKFSLTLRFGRALWIRSVKLDYSPADVKKEVVFSISEYIGKRLYPDVLEPNRFLLKEALINEQKINELVSEGYNEAEVDHIQIKEALERIKKRPHIYLSQNFLEYIKMISFLYIPALNESGTTEKFAQIKNGCFILAAIRGVFKILAFVVLLFACIGFYAERRKWRQWIFVAALICYINISYSFLFGWGRYSVPLIPFYFLFAVSGFSFITNKNYLASSKA